MKNVLIVIASLFALNCASSAANKQMDLEKQLRGSYESAATELMKKAVKELAPEVGKVIPGTDLLILKEVILSKTNNAGVATLSAESKSGQVNTLLYVFFACARVDIKPECVPLAVLDVSQLEMIIGMMGASQ